MANRPNGVDWADGVTPIPSQTGGGTPGTIGTPIPDGTLEIFSNQNGSDDSQLIQEMDGSPELERAEQATSMNSQIMPDYLAASLLAAYGRGTFVEDGAGNLFRVLSAKKRRIGKSAPLFSEFTTIEESISFDTPPDEFSIEESSLGVNIIKNPRYFSALWPNATNTIFGINDYTTTVGAGTTCSVAMAKIAIIRAIQTYQDSPVIPITGGLNGAIQNNVIANFLTTAGFKVLAGASGTENSIDLTQGAGSPACLLALAAANEIVYNLWLQEDTPYVPAIIIRWSQYFFSSPYINPGCYVEDPMLVLPDYFSNPLSTVQGIPNTGDGNEQPRTSGSPSIFDQFPQINPQYFSSTGTNTGTFQYSALRMMDTVDFQRTWFRLNHVWFLAPIGHWNPLIFQQGPRPTQPTDYIPLPTF